MAGKIRPPFAPGQVWEWVLFPGKASERRFRWDILAVGIDVKPDPANAVLWGLAKAMGVRGNYRQPSYTDGVRYQRGDGTITVDSARWLRRRALNAKCIQQAPVSGTAEDGSSSAPKGQGATQDPQDREVT